MQQLYMILLMLLASCLESGSWGKRQHSSKANQLLQPQQSTAALLDVGAEDKQNETLQEGETAYLQCRVKNLQNRSVSWIRLRDSRILAVDMETFISDPRISIMVQRGPEQHVYIVQIRGVRGDDAGGYECQVSSVPKTSFQFHLNVIVPQVRILGPADRYVKEGSSILLECIVSEFLHPPEYILWEHNGSGVAGGTFHAPDNVTRVSTLRLQDISGPQGGNYSCVPARIHAQSVVLHVPDTAEKRLPYNGACGLSGSPLTNILWAFYMMKLAAGASQ